MMRRAVERRRAERSQMIEVARTYVRVKAGAMSIRAGYVVGSVARGDFNVWSDIDVLIIAAELPQRLLDRIDLFSDRPPGVEVFAYTPQEFERERERKNPIVLEATAIGIDVLAELEDRPPAPQSD
jgi:predicted nucleotidyltransferase